MRPEDISMVVAAQTAMADTLSSQADTLKDISKTLLNLSVNQGKMEERIINILEDNKSRDSEVSQLRGRIQKLDNVVTLNKFALNFYPQIVWLLGAALVFGSGITYTFTELIK